MRSGGAIPPPPQKGYLSDTGAIPNENKAKACDTPLCDTISKEYCAIWGGISHWAAKVKDANPTFEFPQPEEVSGGVFVGWCFDVLLSEVPCAVAGPGVDVPSQIFPVNTHAAKTLGFGTV